jgi:hypothetical protein
MKLVLTHHTIDEWCEIRCEQARRLGCSPEFCIRLNIDLRARYEE